MTDKKNLAIDLIIEDLHTCHHEIRIEAKNTECEKELDEIKNYLIECLYSLKNNGKVI